MAKEKTITIRLTATQRACLLKALEELSDHEGDEGCNDLFEGDKLYLLSEKEQLEAVRLGNRGCHDDDEELLVPLSPAEEVARHGGNYTASDYLKKIIERQ